MPPRSAFQKQHSPPTHATNREFSYRNTSVNVNTRVPPSERRLLVPRGPHRSRALDPEPMASERRYYVDPSRRGVIVYDVTEGTSVSVGEKGWGSTNEPCGPGQTPAERQSMIANERVPKVPVHPSAGSAVEATRSSVQSYAHLSPCDHAFPHPPAPRERGEVRKERCLIGPANEHSLRRAVSLQGVKGA